MRLRPVASHASLALIQISFVPVSLHPKVQPHSVEPVLLPTKVADEAEFTNKLTSHAAPLRDGIEIAMISPHLLVSTIWESPGSETMFS